MDELSEYIYCMMTNGGSLTDKGRNFLLRTAMDMWKGTRRKQTLKHDEYEGLVTTRKKIVFFGTRVGIEFVAEIESEEGRFVTTFAVPLKVLERGEERQGSWMAGPPPEILFNPPSFN